VATWAASPQAATARDAFATGFDDQTVRNIVLTSLGGSMVRVHFSNAFSSRPLTIDRAAIGLVSAGAGLRQGKSFALQFAGHGSTVIAPGADAVSDPVSLTVGPLRRLAVSVFLRHASGPPTLHSVAKQQSYVAGGDRFLAQSPAAFAVRGTSWYFIDGVDVLSSRPGAGAIVTLGDSITDGVGSLLGANARWPNDLARRLDARGGARMAVVDEGIGGNRILTNSTYYGPAAVDRFGSDVLGCAGARAVILLEGINDIGMSHSNAPWSAPHTDVSAAQIIAGYERLISDAHRHGLRIFAGTLAPFQGSRNWTAQGEAKREMINRWIQTSGAFDGVIDFAKVLADRLSPLRLNPVYDSGDHLHPNSAGYRAMANAVNLGMLLQAR
jgi:lysophospholipase L1-like esterase